MFKTDSATQRFFLCDKIILHSNHSDTSLSYVLSSLMYATLNVHIIKDAHSSKGSTLMQQGQVIAIIHYCFII